MYLYSYLMDRMKKANNLTKLDIKTRDKFYKDIFANYYPLLPMSMSIKDNCITILMDINIVPASRPRVSKFRNITRSYYNHPYKGFKDYFRNKLEETLIQNSHLIKDSLSLYTGAVSVHITEYRKTDMSKISNKKIENGEFENLMFKPNLLTPDNDNVEKSVMDCAKGLFYKDDSQVYYNSTRKYTSFTDTVEIQFLYLDNI